MAMLYIRPLIVQALLWSAVVHGVFHRPQHVYSESSSLPSPGALPGGSPLTLCDDSRDTDLYSIDRVELYPKPLYIDDIFEVHLYGAFLQPITNNATWTYLARYGNSTEHETGTMDFCNSLDSIDQPDRHRAHECPPEKGFALIMMSAWVMPMFIVPGPYYFRFDAVTKEGERIYCLDAEIYLDYQDKKESQDRGQRN